ncbi:MULTISPECIES: sensor histidine kinase [Clostridium]|uniref:sensor histidine kinase n=1 Tax=Clostridium TaxID=1485 RepID=UPI0005EAE275|nr:MULTISPECIES: sensor histidine kinase KdpD [Clostridium]KJZ86719.1 Osmosensitive K+ channel histidine kinase KdpD [Clostridium sp. IBUN13A]KJZ87467.1 Osmosensitive K+ channel histidine kinase KdpD [Clostridium sp. IBUN125C]KJZ92505.1 Osmosensitive K+ channel histidine kinase KdpD [Clostridium sp. IBUN62F]MDB2139664.1 sensor histidine kinase KdpD [Clostridium butyricum]MDU0323784.1 sensor histidine kinase KdpD [Clostridium butyricum]
MVYERPNPDDVLKAISKEHKKNGKLKIFFGYAAGVGKTFAMLEAAHKSKESGIDVVAGYIEPHTRVETLNLLNGLEMLPNLKVDYKGISLNEFNIDGALERKPDLILVDELAHSNAVGCRHVKRYQDIKELLDNGIDVYTTVNVQHIESLNDIVASITGIIVKERIPDSVFDNADQIELVDIEPEDLIQRLNEGKIYRTDQAKRALLNFFTKEKLVALREIALRRTADAVNKKIDIERERTKNSYYTEEHLLICLSSSPSNAKVIRTAARMADAFHGLFTALFVETTDTKEFQDENRVRLERNLKLAEQLGARIATVYGDDIAWQISEYAKLSGVSKIVLGRSTTKKGLFKTKKTLVDKLTEIAPNIDIYIIPDNSKQKQTKIKLKANLYKFNMVDIAKTFGILFLSTILALIFFEFGYSEANIITIYIFGVLLTSITTSGKRCGILMSILAVLTFNFLFTNPRFTFQAYDKSYPVTFAVMFISSIVTSKLATKVKLEAQQSTRKAYRTEVLLETSQKLQIAKSKEDIFNKTAYQTKKLLDKTIILYKSEKGVLAEPLVFKHENDKDVLEYISEEEKAVAQWTLKNKKHAGATTNTLPGAKCLYLSIRNHEKAFGVIGIPLEKDEFLEAFEKNLLIAVLGESALALEKEEINQSKNKIYIKAEQEKLRSNLLRSISHDLRTPLTSISGNAGILINNSEILSEEKKKSLYLDIYDDSMWLINLVENLLSITRIENGTMKINTEPELVEEVIEEAICHINRKVSEHKINTVIEDDLLMAKMDSGLIIQVIINIINNAIKYTPKDSIITITSKRKNNMAVIEISDNGKGINEESKEKLFDMFFTDNNKFGDGRRGLGLGLALCKSIIDAHEGCIYVRDNKPNGAIFGFTLHIEEVKINE